MPTLIETTAAIRAAKTRFRAAQNSFLEAQCEVAKARPYSSKASPEIEHRYLKSAWALQAAERRVKQARHEWETLIAEASKRRTMQ